jgi:hypothetical protein
VGIGTNPEGGTVLLQNVASRYVKSLNVTVTKRSCTQSRSHKTYASHNTYCCDVLTFCDVFLRFVMTTFWNYYVLKLLRLETITFSDAAFCCSTGGTSTYILHLSDLLSHASDQAGRAGSLVAAAGGGQDRSGGGAGGRADRH